MKTAVVFASKFGGTRAVANHIASSIGADVFDIGKAPADISGYDRIIIGSGVYAGKPSKSVVKFVETNPSVASKASLFLTCMYNDEKGADQLDKISKSLGIADAIFFNKPKNEISAAGSKLEEYIKSL